MSSYNWKTSNETYELAGTDEAASKLNEEKEDGELDDENNSQQVEDDDYDDYDYEEDTKPNENESVSVTSYSETIIPKISELDSIDTSKTQTFMGIADLQITQSITATVSDGPAYIATPSNLNYDNDYEDYDDDDDDDYCINNKRLKIDESEGVNSDDKIAEYLNDSELPKSGNLLIQESSSSTEVENNLNNAVEVKTMTQCEDKKKSQNDSENDNDTESSTSSVLSNKSTASFSSSVLTAISTVSSDSLPISSISSGSLFNSASLEKTKSEVLVDGSSLIGEPKLQDIVDDENKQLGDGFEEKPSPKVPPLKIIYSNSNGGHPYVKANAGNKVASEELRLTRKGITKKEESLQVETCSINQSTKQIEYNSLNIFDSPASNSRSKAMRSSRVASPINTVTKTTPTRRSAALAALNTGRSSPSLSVTAQKTQVAINTEVSLMSSLSNSSSGSASSSTGNQGAITNEMENVIRRKLRSHTRQIQIGDFQDLGRVQLSISNKSPSPLTILNEAVVNFGEKEQHQLNMILIESKAVHQQICLESKEFNSSESVEVQCNEPPLLTAPVVSEQVPTRKKRNRQQQLQWQEQLDLINEIDSLNAALSPISGQANGERKCESGSGNDASGGQGPSQFGNNDSLCASTNLNDESEEANKPALFNCIQKFVDLRSDVTRRREMLMQTKLDIKLPANFQDFILKKKSYLIKSNMSARKAIPFFKPPNEIPDDLKLYYSKQEKERYSLRLRHRVEQDKLIILYEQEVLRTFNKSAREAVNQTIPFSFCSMIKDDEIYSKFRINDQTSLLVSSAPHQSINSISNECMEAPLACSTDSQSDQQSLESAVEPKVNESMSAEEKFLQNLNEIKVKFQKLKDDLIKRQLNESDSLHAVQKMDFQLKIRELSHKYKMAATSASSNTCSTESSPSSLAMVSLNAYNAILIFQQNDLHIPIVHVNNKFDLLDLPSQEQFYSATSTSVPATVTMYA